MRPSSSPVCYDEFSFKICLLCSFLLATPTYVTCNDAGYTWLELSPLTGRKHQVTIETMEESLLVDLGATT